MLRTFYPDECIDSVYEADFEKFWEDGIRGIIFDVDNTLVMHDEPATDRAIDLFHRLKAIGYHVVLMSNNKEPRVKGFFEQVVADAYIYKAGKPSRKSYIKAMQIMKTSRKDTIFFGDQLFTDVWGAKRAKVHGILVKPIAPKEEIQIVLKRKLERIVLYFYRKGLKNED